MATQRRPIPPPFSCQPTTLTVADQHPSKRFNLQGLPFSSVARSTSANGHDFKLVTKTARVHRLALFHPVFALITARQGAHLHSLPSGAPYGEHFQQSSPIVATDDDGFQIVRLKKRNRLPNTSNRCAKYFEFKQKTCLSGVHLQITEPRHNLSRCIFLPKHAFPWLTRVLDDSTTSRQVLS